MAHFEYQLEKDVFIEATCEVCGTSYHWINHVSRKNRSQKKLMDDFQEYLHKQRFGLTRCPSCGYLQSWQYEEWKESRAMLFGLLPGFVLFLIGAVALGLPHFETVKPLFGLALTAVVYIVLSLIFCLPFFGVLDWSLKKGKYHPNKKWLKENTSVIPVPIPPKIRIS